MTLGMQWGTETEESKVAAPSTVVANTRTALWPTRWPAIALQACIDQVESVAPEERARVKFELPCQDCPLNTACLNGKRKELGSLMYDREILTNPRSSESSLFPLELFDPMLNRQAACVPYWQKPFSMEHEYAIVQAWDIAWSEKIGGDWLVCMTGYVHKPSGRRFLLEVERWRRKSFDEQVKMIEAKWQMFRSDAVVIETDAAQQVWAQHMSKNTGVPVIRHTGADKTNLQIGVPGLLILLENRKWEFPYEEGTYRHDEVVNFLSECEAFSWVDGHLEGVGEHDDTVMCWWHLNYGMDRMLFNAAGVESRRGVVPGAR